MLAEVKNAKDNNGNETTSLPSEGKWRVYYYTPDTEPKCWDGNNFKVLSVPIKAGEYNLEHVKLTGDVTVTDRIYIGTSMTSKYDTDANGNYNLPANTKVKLLIENVSGRPVTISQYIYDSKHSNTTFTTTDGVNRKQGVHNNCMFTVWGDCELEIRGTKEAPIIIDGGSTRTSGISNWEDASIRDAETYTGEPFNKIVFGLIESNGILTLENVIIRNVEFSNIYGLGEACDCSCIKLHSNSNKFKLGKTTLKNVKFENIKSPGGGGCILSGYKELSSRTENTKENSKVYMENCVVDGAKQYSSSSSDPFVQGLMRFNNYFTGDVEMNNCIFTNNHADKACAGIYWSSNTPDSSGRRAHLTIDNGTYKNNSSARGSAIYIDYGDATMTGNAFFEDNKCNGDYAGAMFVYQATVNIDKATFKNNSSVDYGGAVVGQNADITINKEAIFEGNHADGGGGGAIYSYWKNKLKINNATFKNNYALSSGWNGRGGALFVYQGGTATGTKCVEINGALFEGNKAKVGGGAVFIMNDWVNEANNDYQDILISGAKFRKNVSAAGGAIGIDGQVADSDDTPRNVNLTLENNEIEDNWACLGGGLLVQEAQVTYSGGLIRNNVANHRKKKDMIAGSTDETIDTTDGIESATGHTIEELWDNAKRKAGYGGGIALTKYGWLKIDTSSEFGIYNNKALLGGDDILSDAAYYSSRVNLPDLWSSGTANLDGLNLPAELKSGLRWMEDYNAGDGIYYPSSGITVFRGKGYKSGDSPGRYRELSAARSKELVKKTFDAGQYNSGYLSVALGYPFIYVTVEKTGLVKGETALFDIYGNGDASGNPYMTICITNKDGDESKCKRIVALTPGTWTVKERTDWTYTYNVKPGTNSQITQTLTTDAVASGTTYTFKFENEKKGAADLVPSAEAAKQNPDMKKEQ
ncbi:MAG: hypothetical protein ACI30S_04005 [Muribaculaceae bacterium]